MQGIFYNCNSLESFSFHDLYIDTYDERTENYINMSYMFYNCNNLKSVYTDIFHYYYYIKDMRGMFYNCSSLTSIDLQRFITHDYYYVNLSYMFYNCEELNYTYFYSNFHVLDMRSMFYNCHSLSSIPIYSFNRSNYINMSRLFYNCYNLQSIEYFENFYISDTREMFYNCSTLEYVNFRPYLVYNNINMTKMFHNCINIKSIIFYLSYYRYCSSCYNYYYFKPNDLHAMFYNCTNLTTLNFWRFDVSNVQDMSYMLYNCKNLINMFSLSVTITKSTRGMFQNCESFTNLNLNNFYSTYLETTWDMFKGCSGLKSLYLSNFRTIKVTDMESMFEGCSNLTSLNLNSFQTENVHYMNKMFKDCFSLQELYFHSISTKSLGTMHQMFYNCQSLVYLDLYTLKEISQTIKDIFTGASNNFTLCLENEEYAPKIFDIINKMDGTVRDCSERCYGYGKSKIPTQGKKQCCLGYEFNGTCYTKCPGKTQPMIGRPQCEFFNCTYFYNYEQDACLDSETPPEGYYENDTILKTIDKCDERCKTCKNKTTEESFNCLTCNDSLPFLYLGNCLETCQNGYYNDSEGILRCSCYKEECKECLEEDLDEGLCVICNDNYYPKVDDIKIKSNSFYCYKDPEKYYLDKDIYKPCYSSCLRCDGKGDEFNHLCTTCHPNYELALAQDSYHYNCYINCPYYYYFDEGNHFKCTFDQRCSPYPYIYLIDGERQCVKSCEETDNHQFRFQSQCYTECPPETRISDEDPKRCKVVCPFERPFEIVELEICVANCTILQRRNKYCITNYEGNMTNEEVQDKVQANIVDEIIKSFNYSLITDNESIVIVENGTTYEIISSKNHNTNSQTSAIRLGSCEYTLKDYYGIGQNEALYILKIDASIEGKTGPTVEYNVYYPFPKSKNLDSLDLTVCEGNEVTLTFPINLTNPELYDKNSPYYNDICYSYKTNGNVDITLDDRKKEYVETNKSLCEEDCEYAGYDEKTSQVECSCQVKINLPLVSEIKIDKNKLYKFMNIKKIANFDFLKCYNLITSKEGIIKNIGFYVFIPTFILYFVCIFLFYKKEYKFIKDYINNIVFAKKNFKYIQIKKKKKKPNKIELKKKDTQINNKNRFVEPLFLLFQKRKNLDKSSRNHLMNSSNNNINKINRKYLRNIRLQKSKITEDIIGENKSDDDDENIAKNKKIDDNNIINDKKINSPPIKNSIKSIQIKKNVDANPKKLVKNNFLKYSNKNLLTINNKSKLTKEERERILLIMRHNDTELNDLEYIQAVKYDHRTYFSYYFSLLKTNHLLFKIINKRDYNSQMIKLYLFVFNFNLNYAVNALFFNDDTMHKIYQDGGDFNFIYQLPQIIYSTIICFVFGFVLDFFALSEKSILDLKHEKSSKNMESKAKVLIRTLHFKFINFFIFSFIFLLIFWYYLSCFCAVYKNTQYHLIKDTLISYGTSMITPIGIYLIPGIFRIPALKKRKSYLYTFSKLFQIL